MDTFFLGSFLAVAITLSGSIHAHTPLIASSPENGETLESAPEKMSFRFRESMKLIEVRITGPAEKMRLRPASEAASKEFSLPLPSLEGGSYSAVWRALGTDGHIMKGNVNFIVMP